MFFETDKLLSDFAPDMIKLQELASKYETVRKTEVVDEETGIKSMKETVIKPNKFANCWTDGVVYNRGADTDCAFKTNAKIYSQEKMEQDMAKLELLEKKREEPWIYEVRQKEKSKVEKEMQEEL